MVEIVSRVGYSYRRLSRDTQHAVYNETILIRTHHGTFVSQDLISGQVCHSRDARETSGYGNILLLASATNAAAGFLVSLHHSSPLLTLRGIESCKILPFRLEKLPGGKKVALRHPDNGLYVCALPVANMENGELTVDRPNAAAWEAFDLSEIEVDGVNLPQEIAFLGKLTSEGLNARSMVATLEAGLTNELVNSWVACMRLLPSDRQQQLATYLMQSGSGIRTLAGSSDPWFSIALPSLLDWLPERKTPSEPMTIGTDLDCLSPNCMSNLPKPMGLLCSSHIRQFVEPRSNVCIVAAARNEGAYLLEWIAYHRAIGIEHFFIYSNDNDDGSDALLSALSKQGIITWVDNKVGPAALPQLKAYRHAFSILPEVLDYRWALVIDLDEYFGFNTALFGSALDFIDWQESRPVEAIALSWLMFGPSGCGRWNSGEYVTQRFDERFASIDPHIKSMVRPNLCAGSHCHYPHAAADRPLQFRDSAGQPYVHVDNERAWAQAPKADHAWVNHYWYKSVEEMMWKRSRNTGDRIVEVHSPQHIISDLSRLLIGRLREQPSVVDRRVRSCAPNFEGFMRELKGLPGVQTAWDEIAVTFSNRLAALREALLDVSDISPQMGEVIQMIRSGQIPRMAPAHI